MSVCDRHRPLTLREKLTAALDALYRTGDVLPDNADVDLAAHLLGEALSDDLASPYCREDGCGQARLPSWPWCERHGPKP